MQVFSLLGDTLLGNANLRQDIFWRYGIAAGAISCKIYARKQYEGDVLCIPDGKI
jgi:hypothetical protein